MYAIFRSTLCTRLSLCYIDKESYILHTKPLFFYQRSKPQSNPSKRFYLVSFSTISNFLLPNARQKIFTNTHETDIMKQIYQCDEHLIPIHRRGPIAFYIYHRQVCRYQVLESVLHYSISISNLRSVYSRANCEFKTSSLFPHQTEVLFFVY